MKTETQQLIKQLAQQHHLKAIYRLQAQAHPEKKLLLLLTPKNTPPQALEALFAVTGQHPHLLFRVYTEDYAVDQHAQGNIFFLHAFNQQNLCCPNEKQPPKAASLKEILTKATCFFKTEYQKAISFQEGAHFYIDNKNHNQAAFMLHQAFELAFRTVELIAMGKEKVDHAITRHQAYLNDFVPELGKLFNDENQTEKERLQHLDAAYRNVRYEHSYTCPKAFIEQLQPYLKTLLKTVENLFHKSYNRLKNDLENPPASNPVPPITLESLLKEFFQEKYTCFNPHTNSFYDKKEIPVQDPLKNFYTLGHLLKVCVLALDYPGNAFSQTIPQPYINIQETLELTIKFLPYEEMELVEKLIQSAGGLKALLDTQQKE